MRVINLTILVFGVLSFFGFFFFKRVGTNKLLIQSEDTIPAMFLPVAVLQEKTIYLDSYYDMMVARYPHPDDKKQLLDLTPFYLRRIGAHYVSAFPIMAGVLALPVYAIPVVIGMPITWDNLIILSRLSSAIIVALSGLFFYRVLMSFLDDKRSTLLAFLYLFATINFASISQALWQHGVLELFTILSLNYLIWSRENKRNLYFAGLFIGFAALSRPTAAISLFFLSAFVYDRFRIGGLLRYLGAFSVSAVLFYVYNSYFYLSISNQGYSSQLLDSWKTPIFQGFLGMWLSPSKGLLIYSPIFIFSLVGAYTVVREDFRKFLVRLTSLGAKSRAHQREIPSFKKQGSQQSIDLFIAELCKYSFLIVLVHTLIVSMWKHWYGGWSFGYRMASDIIPYLILLLIPYLKSSLYERTEKYFKLAIVWSVGTELVGLAFFDGIWHAAYDRGFRNQGWLWSLENSEMVFYVKRVLVKLGLIPPFLP